MGPEPRVLDLACGTGSITDRLLRAVPGGHQYRRRPRPGAARHRRGYLRRATTGSRFVTADLKDPDWPARLPHDSYDAVLTATALHWLHSEPLARAVRADRRAGPRRRRLHERRPHDRRRPPRGSTRPSAPTGTRGMDRAKAAGALDWAEWWAARRRGPGPRRADRPSASRSTASTPTATRRPPTWHARALRDSRASPRPGRSGARPPTRWCSR